MQAEDVAAQFFVEVLKEEVRHAETDSNGAGDNHSEPLATLPGLDVAVVVQQQPRIATSGSTLFSTYGSMSCYQLASSSSPRSAAKRTLMPYRTWTFAPLWRRVRYT